MIHKFIKDSIIIANDEGMLELSPDTYDRKFKVLYCDDNVNNHELILLHLDTGKEYICSGTYNKFFDYGESDTINHEVELILKYYKIKSFSAIDVNGKLIQISLP